MNDLPVVTLEELSTRLEILEQRISRLEHSSTVLATPIEIKADALFETPTAEASQISRGGGLFLFPLLGKAMLGIAGAYVLRAVSESAALPKSLVAAIAMAYAMAWLVSPSEFQKVRAWPASSMPPRPL